MRCCAEGIWRRTVLCAAKLHQPASQVSAASAGRVAGAAPHLTSTTIASVGRAKAHGRATLRAFRARTRKVWLAGRARCRVRSGRRRRAVRHRDARAVRKCNTHHSQIICGLGSSAERLHQAWIPGPSASGQKLWSGLKRGKSRADLALQGGALRRTQRVPHSPPGCRKDPARDCSGILPQGLDATRPASRSSHRRSPAPRAPRSR